MVIISVKVNLHRVSEKRSGLFFSTPFYSCWHRFDLGISLFHEMFFFIESCIVCRIQVTCIWTEKAFSNSVARY